MFFLSSVLRGVRVYEYKNNGFDRMAFTTTQRMDNALMRNLSFRTPLNVPISTQYTLYANGHGQTYWSNSVSPTDLSTVYSNLSASIYTVEFRGVQSTAAVSTSLQTAITFLSADIGNLSTYVSTTVQKLQISDSNLSNSVISLSNNLAGLSYSNFVQINNIYTCTINTVTSTLNNYSNLSSFNAETDFLYGIISTGLSSLSTTIGTQNTSTYNVLTSNYTSYVNNELFDYDINVSSVFSTVFTTYATNYSTQSSILGVENQMQSSVSSLQKQIFDLSTTFTSSFSTIFYSSIYPMNSTLAGHEKRIVSLEALSTSMSSLTNGWISTFVSTSQGIQDSTIQSSIQSLSYLNNSLALSTTQYLSSFLNVSSFIISSFGNQSASISTLTSQVSSLMYEYSILTTSSILGGIYSSFVQLELYTSSIVVANDLIFKSSLYNSTIVMVASTAGGYFDYYVSTMYASTLSTLVPSTQAYYSSIVSTTLWFALSTATSTINVVAANSANAYYSTTSSLTKILLDSTATQLNSSITGNLIIPTQILLSTFSTSFGTNMNTYSTQFYNQFTTQSTMFSSVYCFYSSALSTLYYSSINTLRFFSTQISTLVSSASGQLSSFSTQFGQQLSTQKVMYNSSIAAVTTGLASTLTSTTNAVYTYTISLANLTLNTIQNSTIQIYNDYVTGLNNALSTATYSSLYTEQVLNLTSNTSNVVMDMATYRNFNVNVYNILNTDVKYRLTYNQNTLLGINYRSGFIFINVSTVGQSYTNNNSQLQFDAYQWGLPTTVFGNVYPYISNADYTLQYQYVIQNNRLFTSLMNVYPRLRIQTASVVPVIYNVFNDTNSIYSNVVWRGSRVTVSWTKYSFFPTSLGAPPFNPNVLIDMRINNSTVAEYGPFPFETTSAVVNAPYLTGVQSSNIFDTTVRVYIAGAPTDAATRSFFTLMPTFDNVRMLSPQPPARAYVGGSELVAVTDIGSYPLYSTNIVLTTISGQPSFDGSSNFIPQNINNGLINRVGANGYNITSLLCSTSMVNSITGLVLEPDSLQNWSTIRTGNVTQIGSQISKTTTTSDWDATAYATDGFINRVYVAASPNANRYMSFGLDPSPAGKFSAGFNYTWYFDLDTATIYTSGVLRVSGLSYSTTNRYAIYFDGSRVYFLLNGVEQYSEARTVGVSLFFGCSFFSGSSVFSNVVYSPLVLPVGVIKDASQEIGSTTFFVNTGSLGNTYFSNISSLQQYSTSFAFTFTQLSTNIQFIASSIQLSTGTTSIWRIDSGVANSTLRLSSGTSYMTYSFNPVNRISTSAFYVESTFCGPSISIADSPATAAMNSVNLTASMTPVSTLMYYNLLGNPVQGISTSGMLLQGIVTNGTSNFTSTFVTNGSSNVQIFRM